MKIRLYEVPDKHSSYGTETFLEEFKTNCIPRVGELVGFEGSDFRSYRITDVSYFYSEECENGVAIDVLVVKAEV